MSLTIDQIDAIECAAHLAPDPRFGAHPIRVDAAQAIALCAEVRASRDALEALAVPGVAELIGRIAASAYTTVYTDEMTTEQRASLAALARIARGE